MSRTTTVIIGLVKPGSSSPLLFLLAPCALTSKTSLKHKGIAVFEHAGFDGLRATTRFKNPQDFSQHGLPFFFLESYEHETDVHKIKSVIIEGQSLHHIANLEFHVARSNIGGKHVDHVHADTFAIWVFGGHILLKRFSFICICMEAFLGRAYHKPGTWATRNIENFRALFQVEQRLALAINIFAVIKY